MNNIINHELFIQTLFTTKYSLTDYNSYLMKLCWNYKSTH